MDPATASQTRIVAYDFPKPKPSGQAFGPKCIRDILQANFMVWLVADRESRNLLITFACDSPTFNIPESRNVLEDALDTVRMSLSSQLWKRGWRLHFLEDVNYVWDEQDEGRASDDEEGGEAKWLRQIFEWVKGKFEKVTDQEASEGNEVLGDEEELEEEEIQDEEEVLEEGEWQDAEDSDATWETISD